MRTRRTRAEQVEENRTAVLAAAKQVFLARGYAGATLEAIAEEAGFSKGVVYSRFESKADLFLALLEGRIDERAAQNERLVADAPGAAGVLALLENFERDSRAEADWGNVLVEFRAVGAARHRAQPPLRGLPRPHGRSTRRSSRTSCTSALVSNPRSHHGRWPSSSSRSEPALASSVPPIPDALSWSEMARMLTNALGFEAERALLVSGTHEGGGALIDNTTATSIDNLRARVGARPVSPALRRASNV